jgi:hypothetical protein
VIFFETYSIFFLVFSNSSCRETPENALKKKRKKKKGTYVLFLRAGTDVRRFLVLFFLPPLASYQRWPEARLSQACQMPGGLLFPPGVARGDELSLSLSARQPAPAARSAPPKNQKNAALAYVARRQKIRCHCFLDFFFLSRFRVFIVQKHYKKRFANEWCRKVFTKKSHKKTKPYFSRFFIHVLGRFSARGVQKHDKTISGKNLTSPGTFLASEEPTNHVKARRFLF